MKIIAIGIIENNPLTNTILRYSFKSSLFLISINLYNIPNN